MRRRFMVWCSRRIAWIFRACVRPNSREHCFERTLFERPSLPLRGEQAMVNLEQEKMNAIRGEAQATLGVLLKGRTAKEVAAVALSAYQRVDSAVQDYTGQAGLACGKGCAWCCRGVKVDVLVPEAVAIAEYLRRSIDEGEYENFVRRLREVANQFSAMNSAQRVQSKAPCAFLNDESGQCRIYEVRPNACRKHNSLDATQCEVAHHDTSGRTTVPVHFLLRLTHELSTEGVSVALSSLNLDSSPYELTNAVLVAFENLGAAEEWATGGGAFHAARIPSDDADQVHAERKLAGAGLIPPAQLLRPGTVAKKSHTKTRKPKQKKKRKK